MLFWIGCTLLFASATTGLGVRRALRNYNLYGGRYPVLLYPAIIQTVMTAWFGVAGLWALGLWPD